MSMNISRLQRIVAVILTIGLACVGFGKEKSYGAEEQVVVKLTASRSEVQAGEHLSVTLAIEQNKGVSGLVVRFCYPQDTLSLVSVKHAAESEYKTAVIFPAQDMLEEGANLDATAEGRVGFAYVEMKNNQHTGDIVVADFLVKTGAKAGEATFTYEYMDASNAAGEVLEVSGKEATFQVVQTANDSSGESKAEPSEQKQQSVTDKGNQGSEAGKADSTTKDIQNRENMTEPQASGGNNDTEHNTLSQRDVVTQQTSAGESAVHENDSGSTGKNNENGVNNETAKNDEGTGITSDGIDSNKESINEKVAGKAAESNHTAKKSGRAEGVVVGCVAVVVLMAGMITYIVIRKRKISKPKEENRE